MPPSSRSSLLLAAAILATASGAPCPNNCTGHGGCIDGACVCDAGWAGDDCAQRSCGADCEHGGLCHEGTCYCKPGFHGPNCQYTLCPDGCNGHGLCINGTCTCEDGWVGLDCAELSCPRDCGGHGVCLLGQDCADCVAKHASDRHDTPATVPWQCECHAGWGGATCEARLCADGTDCGAGSMHGMCVDGSCQCAGTRTGEACELDICDEGCGEAAKPPQGACDKVQQRCACLPGFRGRRCEQRICPSPSQGAAFPAGMVRANVECGGNGECDGARGACLCRAGFTGAACEVPTCEGGCGQHGNCVAAPGGEEPPACVCYVGFAGADCSVHTCPGDCSGVGFCSALLNYTCVCPAGRTGADCSQPACHRDCASATARCVEGACVCASGWHGPLCEHPTCDKGCSGHGMCEPRKGGCVCDEGWFGQDCSQATCPADCHVATRQGTCHDGKCTCASGWGGADCGAQCSDGGAGAGKLGQCGGRGQCFAGRCHCEPGWTGHFCGLRTCLLHCSGNGFCFNGSCTCAAGYAGRDCARATTPSAHDCRYGCVRSCADRCVHAQRHIGPHVVELEELEGGVFNPEEGAAGGCFAACRRQCIGKCTAQLALPAVDSHSDSLRVNSEALGRAASQVSLQDAMHFADSALRPNGPALRRERAL